MVFNSIQFICLFLPIVVCIYFLLNKYKLVKVASLWLLIASFAFYGYADVKFVPLLIFSIIFNYWISVTLNKNKENPQLVRKGILAFGIFVNVALLCYFKYMDFFLQNINLVFQSNLPLLHIALPLGISFFTFQQIAYIVDTYKGEIEGLDFLNYSLFVSFFPKLGQGPIVRNSEMMPQLTNLRTKIVNWENLSLGLFWVLIGLFKKVVIADTLAKWANLGFATANPLSILEAWFSMLSYTMQIYYDFSGYTTMALGVALMLNIKIPDNFNNPYIALDIQDFWRRWHITLSRFLKDYLYIPLGGNRKGKLRTYINIAIIFFVCGLWHGASWLFILWGCLHGVASIINRLWKQTAIEMPKWLAWLITFLFVNFAWVFFRAPNLTIAKNIFKSAIGFNGFAIPEIYGLRIEFFPNISALTGWDTAMLFLIPILIVAIFVPKVHAFKNNLKPKFTYALFMAILFAWVILTLLNPDYSSPFIYFNF